MVDYKNLQQLTDSIESELKALKVWSDKPLSEEKFDNMGAFGMNTMALTEWIQFVLLPILQDLINNKAALPNESMIAAHAIREFDGQSEYDHLIRLLEQLDDVANGADHQHTKIHSAHDQVPPDISFENVLPDYMLPLFAALPQQEGDILESTLQSIDQLAMILPEGSRLQIANQISGCISGAKSPSTRLRLTKALQALHRGENMCEPYNHEEAMKKYQEQFKKDFPDATFE